MPGRPSGDKGKLAAWIAEVISNTSFQISRRSPVTPCNCQRAGQPNTGQRKSNQLKSPRHRPPAIGKNFRPKGSSAYAENAWLAGILALRQLWHSTALA
jgi:hypothetical protein